MNGITPTGDWMLKGAAVMTPLIGGLPRRREEVHLMKFHVAEIRDRVWERSGKAGRRSSCRAGLEAGPASGAPTHPLTGAGLIAPWWRGTAT